MRFGLLDCSFEECATRSWAAFSSAITPNGHLLVSEATPEGDLELYQSLGLGVFPWGQGAALRAIEERIITSSSLQLSENMAHQPKHLSAKASNQAC
jgi:hypothetical protein